MGVGQSASRKFGNLVSRKNGQPENRKKLVLHVLWLVLHVLATTVSTFGTFFTMGILKKSRRTDMSYFSSPPGSQARCAGFYIDGSVGGSVGRWLGGSVRTSFFFCFFLENDSIYFASYFRSPY